MTIWRVPFPKFGDGVGFARISAIAAWLGIDLAAFGDNAAAVAGSNGKGSTAAMCAAILAQTGRPVGLFTSPHLFALNERFAINGDAISDEDLRTHWDRVASAADGVEGLGGFEFLFLFAANWFAARGCAFTIWEAGIGGRYDPVRLIRARRAALTSLDLEHTKLLGDTLEQIAFDKIDIAPEGARLFVGPNAVPLQDRIEAYCALRRVTPRFISGADLGVFTPPLAGAFQRANAALAVELARDMAPLDQAAVAAGLLRTRWPGRLEVLQDDPLVVIDVGHTPDAIRQALDGFTELRGARPGVLVCGVSSDKDADEIIAALAAGFATIICVAARHKGRPAGEIALRATAACPGSDILVAGSMAEAHRLALNRAIAQGGAVYAAGGLFVAAEFKAAHLGIDPASLAFL